MTLTLTSSCPTTHAVPGVMRCLQRQQWAMPAATSGRSVAFAALCSAELYLARRATSAAVTRFRCHPLLGMGEGRVESEGLVEEPVSVLEGDGAVLIHTAMLEAG